MDKLRIDNDPELQLDIHKVIQYYQNEYADDYSIVFYSADHGSPSMAGPALDFYNSICAGPPNRLRKFGFRHYWCRRTSLTHRLDPIAVLKTLVRYGNYAIGEERRNSWGALLIRKEYQKYLFFSEYDDKQTPHIQSELYFHDMIDSYMISHGLLSKDDYVEITRKWKKIDYEEIWIER